MNARVAAGLGALILALALLYGVIWGDLAVRWSWQGYVVLLTALFLVTVGGKVLYDEKQG